MVFDSRKYVIIQTTDIDSVDFTEVLETNTDTCRHSVDGTKTFIKYDGAMPYSIANIHNKSAEYTHEDMLLILSNSEWVVQE